MNKFIFFILLTPFIYFLSIIFTGWMVNMAFPEKSSEWQVKHYGNVSTVINVILVLAFWSLYFL